MKDEWPLLPGERMVPFVCGFVAGVCAAMCLIRLPRSFGRLLFVLGTGIAFGVLAALFGDRFWKVLTGWSGRGQL